MERVTTHKTRLNLCGRKQEFGTTTPMCLWLHGLPCGFSLFLASYSIGPFAKFTLLWPIHKPPLRWTYIWSYPRTFTPSRGNSNDHVLKLLANIYGQKQAGWVWNNYLLTKLQEINFKQSLIDDFVFYQDDVIFIVYVDDGIFLGSSDKQLRGIINKIQNFKLYIEDQGNPVDYVGVNIKKLKDGIIELLQWALINSIIAEVELGNSKVKAAPAKVSKILHAHLEKPPFSFNFGYISVIGKRNYLAQTTRPDIYATHQLAKYSFNPREPHGETVIYLVCYLKKTCDLGTHFKPDQDKGLKCYCDTDFSGNWNKHLDLHDPSTANSSSGWIMFNAGCLVIWASKLQTQVTLSTTEAEYIAMSQSLWDILLNMFLVQEICKKGFPVICTKPYIYCKVFEDNSSVLELARLPKLCPRTKHINVCCHNFLQTCKAHQDLPSRKQKPDCWRSY